jgi:hypothetical protein
MQKKVPAAQTNKLVSTSDDKVQSVSGSANQRKPNEGLSVQESTERAGPECESEKKTGRESGNESVETAGVSKDQLELLVNDLIYKSLRDPPTVSLMNIPNLVDNQVDKHLDRVERTVKFAGYIFVAVFTVAASVLAYFTVKSAGEMDAKLERSEKRASDHVDQIKKDTQSRIQPVVESNLEKIKNLRSDLDKAMKDGVEKILKDNEPTRWYRERVDLHYDRILVDSYTVQLKRGRDSYPYTQPLVSKEDRDRMFVILKSGKSDLALFTDALNLWFRLGDTWKEPFQADVQKLYKSLKDQENEIADLARRLVLLYEWCGWSRSSALLLEARKQLINRSDGDEVLAAAIVYLAAMDDRASLKDFAGGAESQNPRVKQACLEALARFDPSSSALRKWINEREAEFKREAVTAAVFSEICDLVYNLELGQMYYEDKKNDNLRLDFSERLVRLLMKQRLRLVGKAYATAALGIEHEKGSITVQLGPRPIPDLSYHLAKVARRIAKKGDSKDLNSLLECVCLRTSVSGQEWSLGAGLFIQLAGTTTVNLEDGTKLTATNAPEEYDGSPVGVVLLPQTRKKVPRVLWTDTLGLTRPKSADLKAISIDESAQVLLYEFRQNDPSVRFIFPDATLP